jgi:hypothetical protein
MARQPPVSSVAGRHQHVGCLDHGGDGAALLAGRLPTVGMFGLFLEQNRLADQFRFGREADDTRHGAGKTWTYGLFLDMAPAPNPKR